MNEQRYFTGYGGMRWHWDGHKMLFRHPDDEEWTSSGYESVAELRLVETEAYETDATGLPL